MENETTQNAQPQLLALDVAERVVSWRDISAGRAPRRHFFRPPTKEEVKAFYRTRVRKLGQSAAEDERNARRAILNLYELLIQRCDGYTLKGGVPLMQHEEWKRLMPESDRRLAVACLMRVDQHQGETAEEIDPEFETVSLDALWGESAPGEMAAYRGLVHRFARLTAEEEAAMGDDLSRHIAVGGSRNGETIPALRQAVLLKWYARQIRAVEGYSVTGTALEGERNIAQHMDLFHQIVAMELMLRAMPAAELTPLNGPAAEDEELA